MIAKKYKFPLRTDFIRFRKVAKRLALSQANIFYFSTTSSRFAVVIPKKTSKLATTRNWLKRLTYDTLWPLIKERKINMVVVYKPLPLHRDIHTKQLIISELTHVIQNL